MLELLLCSLFTILPDYLYRRYGQGKRFGQEITFYSVWYEFRYGITTCLMLDNRSDYGGLLLPPVDQKRHRLFSHRPHSSGNKRTRRGGLS